MEVDAKMKEILKKLDLSAHSVRFVEEKISPDIACKLSIEDFHNLGINDRNAIMSLRIACSTFGSYTPRRGCHTNKFVIPKIFLENLIQEGFTVREISAIAGVSERTIYRRMTEYDLKIRDFSRMSDNQLDLEVLALTNDYPFCGEIMLRELLKGRGFNVERCRLRDSIHRVNDIGVQARKKGRLKRRVYNVKGANHLWHIDTNHKLIKWYIIIFGPIDGYSRLLVSLECISNNKATSNNSAVMFLKRC